MEIARRRSLPTGSNIEISVVRVGWHRDTCAEQWVSTWKPKRLSGTFRFTKGVVLGLKDGQCQPFPRPHHRRSAAAIPKSAFGALRRETSFPFLVKPDWSLVICPASAAPYSALALCHQEHGLRVYLGLSQSVPESDATRSFLNPLAYC